MEYEKMLEHAYANLPAKTKNTERFEMPEPDSLVQGNKTIVKNFGQIINALHREQKHMLKFLTKETATSAVVAEGKLILNSKFPYEQIKRFFGAYLKEYVLCHECGKPDTKFFEQHGVKMMKCEACGAVAPVKRL